MGITRKTLSVLSLGAIDVMSDKERVARSARLTKRYARRNWKESQVHTSQHDEQIDIALRQERWQELAVAGLNNAMQSPSLNDATQSASAALVGRHTRASAVEAEPTEYELPANAEEEGIGSDDTEPEVPPKPGAAKWAVPTLVLIVAGIIHLAGGSGTTPDPAPSPAPLGPISQTLTDMVEGDG